MKPIKENEITDEILDNYIEECRKEIGDEKDIGNLITFDLAKIKNGQIEEGRKGMLRWYKSELARDDKLLCGVCGNIMEQYYVAKCYHCITPEDIIKDGAYNLMEAMNFMDHKECDFDKDSFWDSLIDEIPGNDSYFKLYFEEDENHKLMLKYFPNGKLWHVSW